MNGSKHNLDTIFLIIKYIFICKNLKILIKNRKSEIQVHWDLSSFIRNKINGPLTMIDVPRSTRRLKLQAHSCFAILQQYSRKIFVHESSTVYTQNNAEKSTMDQ